MPRGLAVREEWRGTADAFPCANPGNASGPALCRRNSRAGKHHAFHASGIISSRRSARCFRVRRRRITGVLSSRESLCFSAFADFPRSPGQIRPSRPTEKSVVFLRPAVNVNGKRQVFAGLEEVAAFLQQQAIRAKDNILLAGHQTSHDLFNLGVISGSPAGDGTPIGAAAFVHRFEAIFPEKLLLQHCESELNFSAAPRKPGCTCKAASSIRTSGYCFRP